MIELENQPVGECLVQNMLFTSSQNSSPQITYKVKNGNFRVSKPGRQYLNQVIKGSITHMDKLT